MHFAERRNRRSKGAFHLRLITHVTHEGMHAAGIAAFGRQSLLGLGSLFVARAPDGHRRASSQQCAGHAVADTAIAASDDGALAGQVEGCVHVGLLDVFWSKALMIPRRGVSVAGRPPANPVRALCRHSGDDNYLGIRLRRIEPFDECRTPLQTGTLVDVTLVSEFIAIDRRRLGHQHDPRNAHARASR